jgi:phage terminase Nu1 subunit (DNA packaging protein)
MQQFNSNLSPGELSAALGVSKATISRWKTQGCPYHEAAPFAIGAQASRPRYNLEAVKAWIKSKQDTPAGHESPVAK